MDDVPMLIDGEPVRARVGISVAAAVLNAGCWTFRRSLSGVPRGPVCAMGVCFECRLTIDGVPHRRACLVTVAPGMDVRTHD